MPPILCALCHEKLDPDGDERFSWDPPTNAVGHTACFDNFRHSSGPLVQKLCEYQDEPSWKSAKDEVWAHSKSGFEERFAAFFVPKAGHWTPLPAELLFLISSCLHDSRFDRKFRLWYMNRAVLRMTLYESLRIANPYTEEISLYVGAAFSVRYTDQYNGRYVSSVRAVSKNLAGQPGLVFLDPAAPWTHLVLELDVHGCRSFTLRHKPVITSTAGIWYRVFPRVLMSPDDEVLIPLKASFKGGTLRDVTGERGPPRLFDTVPLPRTPMRFYTERVGMNVADTCPRMMRRDLNATVRGISIALYHGATLDLQLHTTDEEVRKRYRQLENFLEDAIAFRYAKLEPNERLIELGVRYRKVLRPSSTCPIFITSHGRVIDLAHEVSAHQREQYDLKLLSADLANCDALYINKRCSIHEAAVYAIADTPGIDSAHYRLEAWWANWKRAGIVIAKSMPLTVSYATSFRDELVIGKGVELYLHLRVPEEGTVICKGLRTSSKFAGSCLDEYDECKLIRPEELEQWSFENITWGSRPAVKLVQSRVMAPPGSVPLLVGHTLVWWTNLVGQWVELLAPT